MQIEEQNNELVFSYKLKLREQPKKVTALLWQKWLDCQKVLQIRPSNG